PFRSVDVPLGLYAGVAVEPVQGATRGTPRALGAAGLAEARRVGREDREHGDRVRAVPFAGFPGLVPSRRSAGREPNQAPPVADVDLGLESRLVAAEPPDRAVGQSRTDRARFEPDVDAVENLVEATG